MISVFFISLHAMQHCLKTVIDVVAASATTEVTLESQYNRSLAGLLAASVISYAEPVSRTSTHLASYLAPRPKSSVTFQDGAMFCLYSAIRIMATLSDVVLTTQIMNHNGVSVTFLVWC